MDIVSFFAQISSKHPALLLAFLIACLVAIALLYNLMFASKEKDEKPKNTQPVKEEEEEMEDEWQKDEIHLKSGKIITVEYASSNLTDDERVFIYDDDYDNNLLCVPVNAVDYIIYGEGKKHIKIEG